LSFELKETGDYYYEAGQYDSALLLYEYVLSAWPDSENAIFAKFGVVRCNIRKGNTQEAGTALNQLLDNLPSEMDLSVDVTDVARAYLETGEYESAQQLYQYVIDTWPESEDVIMAYSSVGWCQAAKGEDSQAMATLSFVLDGYAGHPNLGNAVLDISEPYYEEGFRLKAEGEVEKARIFLLAALEIADIVKARDPEGVETFDTYCWMGASYSGLEENQKALECYKDAVEKFPENPLAWHALFKIGQIYERLKQKESINASECDLNIRQAYLKLLEMYPDCKAAKAAQNWLNRHSE